MNTEWFEESIDEAIIALEKMRNCLAGGDAMRQDHIDPAVLTTIFDINELEAKIRRLKKNSKEEFMKRWKENAFEALEDFRCEREIKNMLLDFALDMHKAEIVSFPENATFKEVSDFIYFWMKENFRSRDGERAQRDRPAIVGTRRGFRSERETSNGACC